MEDGRQLLLDTEEANGAYLKIRQERRREEREVEENIRSIYMPVATNKVSLALLQFQKHLLHI